MEVDISGAKIGPVLRGSVYRYPRVVAKPEVGRSRPCGEVRLHETNHQQKSAQRGAICRSSSLLAANLPLLPRRLQLPVALRVDLLLTPDTLL